MRPVVSVRIQRLGSYDPRPQCPGNVFRLHSSRCGTARVGRMRRPREADLKRNIPCAGSMIVASGPPGGGAPDTVESNGRPATAFRQGTRPIRARGN